jgi:hypothetical protein
LQQAAGIGNTHIAFHDYTETVNYNSIDIVLNAVKARLCDHLIECFNICFSVWAGKGFVILAAKKAGLCIFCARGE